MGLILLSTGVFLLLRFPALPDLLPVHFNRWGVTDGWQFRTVPRVLMPLFVQLALALILVPVVLEPCTGRSQA